MCEQELQNEEVRDESLEEIRNKLLKPFIGQGIYEGKPPDYIGLLKCYGKNYRSKMSKALIDIVGHDGD